MRAKNKRDTDSGTRVTKAGPSRSRTAKAAARRHEPVGEEDSASVTMTPQLVGATLREQRRRLNLTLEEVARRVGITKGFLSEVERDNATPSVATLMRLREALSLSIASVFTSSQPRIVRAKHRQEILLGGTDIAYSLLSGKNAHRVTMVWGRLDPGASSGNDMHTLSADEEIIFVLSGTFEITMDGATHTLNAGDAFTFDPRRPHRYANPSKTKPVVAVCIIAPPPRDRPASE
jgi:transcriptional regulator with XRE-family HTH domain